MKGLGFMKAMEFLNDLGSKKKKVTNGKTPNVEGELKQKQVMEVLKEKKESRTVLDVQKEQQEAEKWKKEIEEKLVQERTGELVVVTGATLRCSQGSKPGTLTTVTGYGTLAGGIPVATTGDTYPLAVIGHFGACKAASSPEKIVMCMPDLCCNWFPYSFEMTAGNLPVLIQSSQMQCARGGCISVASPGQGSKRVRPKVSPV